MQVVFVTSGFAQFFFRTYAFIRPQTGGNKEGLLSPYHQAPSVADRDKLKMHTHLSTTAARMY